MERIYRCILTVVCKDKPNIISKVSGLLADKNVNIEDITQTIINVANSHYFSTPFIS